MHECVDPSRFVDDVPAHLVDVGGGDAGLDRIDTGLLRLGHDRDHALERRRRRRPDADRAGHVRAVAVDHGAEVEHDEFAGFDAAIRRASVRLGAVGSRSHDRFEGVAARAQSADLEVELERELGLADALGEPVQYGGEGVVGDATGLGDTGHLASVLDPAQLLDQTLGGDQFGVGQPVVGDGALAGPSDVGGLEADPTNALACLRDRVALAAECSDLDARVDACPFELLGGLEGVAAIGNEQCVVGQHHQECSRAGEPGEVADVHEIGEQALRHTSRAGSRSRKRPSRAPTSITGRLMGLQHSRYGVDSQVVAQPAEPADAAVGNRRDHRCVAPRLTGVRIRDVQFDHLPLERGQRVVEGPAVVRQGGRVHDDGVVAPAPPWTASTNSPSWLDWT